MSFIICMTSWSCLKSSPDLKMTFVTALLCVPPDVMLLLLPLPLEIFCPAVVSSVVDWVCAEVADIAATAAGVRETIPAVMIEPLAVPAAPIPPPLPPSEETVGLVLLARPLLLLFLAECGPPGFFSFSKNVITAMNANNQI